MDTFVIVDMYIFIVIAFLWTPLINNQILRYVVYKPYLLLLLLYVMLFSRDSVKYYILKWILGIMVTYSNYITNRLRLIEKTTAMKIFFHIFLLTGYEMVHKTAQACCLSILKLNNGG